MSFFNKQRSGPKVGGDCKKGGGIKGIAGNVDNYSASFKIPGAGESKGYDQNVVKRSGSKL